MVTAIDFIVEEPSMEAFLRAFLPKFLGDQQFNIYPFQDKGQLLTRLPDRLKGYAKWIQEDHRIVVIVDRDDEACDQLKAQLEQMASDANTTTLNYAPSWSVTGGCAWYRWLRTS